MWAKTTPETGPEIATGAPGGGTYTAHTPGKSAAKRKITGAACRACTHHPDRRPSGSDYRRAAALTPPIITSSLQGIPIKSAGAGELRQQTVPVTGPTTCRPCRAKAPLAHSPAACPSTIPATADRRQWHHQRPGRPADERERQAAPGDEDAPGSAAHLHPHQKHPPSTPTSNSLTKASPISQHSLFPAPSPHMRPR